MGAFWNSWQLWEKLCFCLAIAIFLTLCAGCVKLLQQRWQLRKYTTIAAKRMEERQSLQQEVQRAMSTRRERKNDVPFGVRAIESGIEVDGVWISRGNTPVPGSPVSFAARSPSRSNRRDRQSSALRSTSSIPDLAMPQPVHPITKPATGRSTNASSRSVSPDSRFERSRGSSIASHSPRRGSSAQPGGEVAPQRRQSYRPRRSSHLRYSSADVRGSSEFDVVTDSNRPPQHYLINVRSGSDSSLSPDSYSGHYMPTKPSPTKRQSSVIPQTLNPTSVSPTNGHDGQFTFERIPLDNLAIPSPAQHDPFLTPRESPTEERQGYFATTGARNGQDGAGDSPPEDYETPYLDQSSTPRAKDGDVIRKVNSGFEILRPGTLGQKGSGTPQTYQPTGAGGSSKKPSRKLQKRMRSSTSASRKSMFSEDVV